jgi:dihydrolipoamide dehydrogenase
MGELMQETEVLVIGSGPGGYAAAFRAADLGLEVTMVDTAARPGGECLFRGCIPSKTLLFLTELLYDARRAKHMGITFHDPQIDLGTIRDWKGQVIDRLANGLVNLSDRRGVQLLRGRAKFEDGHHVRLYDCEVNRLKYKYAIIATGSHPTPFPGMEFKVGGRIMSSAGALALADIPTTLLVLGGGYVGLELGSVYASLGSQVTLVEMTDRLLPGVDPDLVAPLHSRLATTFKHLHFNTRLVGMLEDSGGVTVTMEGEVDQAENRYERALVAIGRRPNSKGLGLENTQIVCDDSGYIQVDQQQRTQESHIFAIGDVVGGLMLAHKAIREGKVAAEVIAGEPTAFDARAIPAIVYTDPQIAWCGLTEEAAKNSNLPIKVERFPWKFSGRAATMDSREGLTKIIIDPETERIVGMGITGRDSEGLIAEGVLAIEMGALAQDLALTIHAHPTLSETVEEADELFLGTAIHILPPKIGKTL